MPSMTSNRASVLGAVAAGLWLGLLPAPAAAQVTYFERPPTAAELRAALLGQPRPAPAATDPGTDRITPGGPARLATEPLPPGHRTRGIQWTAPPAPAAAAAGRPAATGFGGGAGAAGTAGVVAGTAAAPAIRESSVMASGAASGAAAGAVTTATAGRAVATLPPVADLGTPFGAAALPIRFRLGSSRVETDSQPYVEAVASVLRSDPALTLVIEGHTDMTGDAGRNLVLSWDRALGVMRSLVEDWGIDATRLTPLGRGAVEPLPGRSSYDAANRRVQFRLASPG